MKRIAPYYPEHVRELCTTLRAPERPTVAVLESLEAYARQQAETGPCATLEADGRIVACLGLDLMPWPGVAEAWALVAEDAYRERFWLHRFAKRAVREQMSLHRLHRIQASIRAEDATALRWALSIGFREEGVMRAYGSDGADYLRVAMVREH